jgi:2-phosphosulfolactate phosphatase
MKNGDYFKQTGFNLRCEWGLTGVTTLAPISDAVVIVDVLSFSTSVDIAVGRGAVVYPYRGSYEDAPAYAASLGAILAEKKRGAQFSLSPASLTRVPEGTRLVLPSPNGSTLSLSSGDTPTLAGCLRNYRAIAQKAQRHGSKVSIIPAGERWPDGSLRPAVEDWLGAGAVLSQLDGSLSPMAQAAVAAFLSAQAEIEIWLRQSGSGIELIEQGYKEDVRLAAEIDISECTPVLVAGAYR